MIVKKKRYKLKPDVFLYLFVIVAIVIVINKFYDSYKDHKYKDTLEYKLIDKGYTKDDIKLLSKYYNNKELTKLSKKKKDRELLELMNNKMYIHSNLNDYLTYIDLNPNKSVDDAISVVNLHLNYDSYEKTFLADTSKNELVLVNKYYNLPEGYTPDNLVTISQKYSWGDLGSQKVKEEVFDAFMQMHQDAEANGIYLMIQSSYKSFEQLEAIYERNCNAYGEAVCETFLSKAGFNEVQTGYTLDIFSLKDSLQSTFKDSETYAWLKDNAYKYGFIIRYPEGKEKITKIDFMPWHFRYVGKEAAEKIYNDNISFEEYYIYNIEIKK